ncbi:hypothetical protein ACIA8K_35465 [Catenuloplanes sp. NPDC051500]|uniref:hypothetical protein n=1 Tax=Catenuloplanes sp. NPDC051500 TaxID=3363959 RepID=UPI0037A2B719
MPVSTSRNTTYGSPEITNKYAPLANIVLSRGDAKLYSSILNKRVQILAESGLFPSPLTLYAENWTAIEAAERAKDRQAPLIVISSNRSVWIRNALAAAETVLDFLGLDAFEGVGDLRAVATGSANVVSPPIYARERIGPHRGVYVLVHETEYRTYRRVLGGVAGLTVVGWSFRTAVRPSGVELVGFGAVRYAAVAFCKNIRTTLGDAAGAPWNKAWIVDDNVVGLTGLPRVEQPTVHAGLDAVEFLLGDSNVCAGFLGTSKAVPITGIRADASSALNADPASTKPPKDTKFVQQAVLWNIKLLIGSGQNFSPVFVNAQEDQAFHNYLLRVKYDYLYFKGVRVLKELVTRDSDFVPDNMDPRDTDLTAALIQLPANSFQEKRNRFIKWVTGEEFPFTIKPDNAGNDGGEQPLRDFIEKSVLPGSPAMTGVDLLSRAGPVVVAAASCQAVEQILSESIAQKMVTDDDVKKAFALPADRSVVERQVW